MYVATGGSMIVAIHSHLTSLMLKHSLLMGVELLFNYPKTIFSNTYLKYWISVDDYQIARTHVVIEIDNPDGEKGMTGEFDLLQNYYEYGTRISFSIPEEARNAPIFGSSSN
jgi:hypothetical protein